MQLATLWGAKVCHFTLYILSNIFSLRQQQDGICSTRPCLPRSATDLYPEGIFVWRICHTFKMFYPTSFELYFRNFSLTSSFFIWSSLVHLLTPLWISFSFLKKNITILSNSFSRVVMIAKQAFLKWSTRCLS